MTKFFVILGHFLPLYPTPTPNNTENQHFEKMKTKPRDVIILQMFTINNNHMMYVMYGS